MKFNYEVVLTSVQPHSREKGTEAQGFFNNFLKCMQTSPGRIKI